MINDITQTIKPSLMNQSNVFAMMNVLMNQMICSKECNTMMLYPIRNWNKETD